MSPMLVSDNTVYCAFVQRTAQHWTVDTIGDRQRSNYTFTERRHYSDCIVGAWYTKAPGELGIRVGSCVQNP